MFHKPVPQIKASPNALEVSEVRFRRFLKDLDGYERHLLFERTLDAFLDLYSSYQKRHDRTLKMRLVMLVFELHRLNPAFECDLSFADEAA
jgi:hypothetical protein